MLLSSNINIDFLGNVNFILGLSIQVGAAILIGFIIGLNRELSNKAAGIKTNIMICIGATLYTSISVLNVSPEIAGQDPNRLAAQIVSGIGFLGAGAIMRSDGHISGLTTAATIWVVAALGVTIGFGYPLVAFAISTIVLLILYGTNKMYSVFMITKNYKIKILSDNSILGIIKGMIINSSVEVIKINEGKTDGLGEDEKVLHKTKIVVEANSKTIKSFVRLTKKIKSVKKATFSIID